MGCHDDHNPIPSYDGDRSCYSDDDHSRKGIVHKTWMDSSCNHSLAASHCSGHPVYVLFVVGVGIFRMVAPKKFNGSNAPFSAVPNRGHKKWHGRFKTAEISLESAIETCLGEFVQSLPFLNRLSSQASTLSSCLGSTPNRRRSSCSWAAS